MSDVKAVVPSAAILSAADFVKTLACTHKHNEAVSDCAHCNLSFLAQWATNLLSDHAALERRVAELEGQLAVAQRALRNAVCTLSTAPIASTNPELYSQWAIDANEGAYLSALDKAAAQLSQPAERPKCGKQILQRGIHGLTECNGWCERDAGHDGECSPRSKCDGRYKAGKDFTPEKITITYMPCEQDAGHKPPCGPKPTTAHVPVPAGTVNLLDPKVIEREAERGEEENRAEYGKG